VRRTGHLNERLLWGGKHGGEKGFKAVRKSECFDKHFRHFFSGAKLSWQLIGFFGPAGQPESSYYEGPWGREKSVHTSFPYSPTWKRPASPDQPPNSFHSGGWGGGGGVGVWGGALSFLLGVRKCERGHKKLQIIPLSHLLKGVHDYPRQVATRELSPRSSQQ